MALLNVGVTYLRLATTQNLPVPLPQQLHRLLNRRHLRRLLPNLLLLLILYTKGLSWEKRGELIKYSHHIDLIISWERILERVFTKVIWVVSIYYY